MVDLVGDTLDLDDAVHLYLPKSLTMANGEVLSGLAWHVHDDLPENRSYPLLSFENLNEVPRGPVRKNTPNVTEVLTEQEDDITFVDGTLDYELSQHDAESITSVTGTLSGSPHTFVLTTDYILLDLKTIRWTGTGDMPDDDTEFTVTYDHRMYKRQFGADGTATYRLHIAAKQHGTGANRRGKSKMAKMVAQAVSNYLRLNAGKVMYKPPLTTQTPYTQEVSAGDLISANREYGDPSEGIVAWAVDFNVKVSSVIHGPLIPTILTAPIDSDFDH